MTTTAEAEAAAVLNGLVMLGDDLPVTHALGDAVADHIASRERPPSDDQGARRHSQHVAGCVVGPGDVLVISQPGADRAQAEQLRAELAPFMPDVTLVVTTAQLLAVYRRTDND